MDIYDRIKLSNIPDISVLASFFWSHSPIFVWFVSARIHYGFGRRFVFDLGINDIAD